MHERMIIRVFLPLKLSDETKYEYKTVPRVSEKRSDPFIELTNLGSLFALPSFSDRVGSSWTVPVKSISAQRPVVPHLRIARNVERVFILSGSPDFKLTHSEVIGHESPTLTGLLGSETGGTKNNVPGG